MDLKAGRELLRFASVGAAAAVRRAWNRDDGERFLAGALAEMPGAPAKIGQLLGIRSLKDIPSPEAMSVADVKSLIATSNPKLNEALSEISPWARTASLGQTHQAQLLTGEMVAIKVQYPGVRSQLASQIDIVFGLAGMSPARRYEFDVGATREFIREKMLEETNYLHEAESQRAFSESCKSLPVIVPRVFAEYCTETVLVQSWEASTPIFEVGKEWIYRDQLGAAKAFSRFVVESVLGSGLMHTDLSPGNYGFSMDGDQVRLVLYDYGSTYRLSSNQQLKLWRWLEATKAGDHRGVEEGLIGIGFSSSRLQPIAPKLLELSNLLLQPWLDGRTWNAHSWQLQTRFDCLLGLDKWWFRTAGPPWFMYLMRAMQGWHHGMLLLDAQIDFSAIAEPVLWRMETVSQHAEAVAEPLQHDERAAEFVPKARLLKVHVTERGEDVVELELPARAVVDLESILPDHVADKCASDGIDLMAIRDRAVSSDGIPQELFVASYGDRRYRVWLAS